VVFKSSKRLGRWRWTATRHGVTVKNLAARGVTEIRLVLRNGALRPSAALQSRAASRKAPRLKFRLRVTDTAKRSFTMVRKASPRS
jgi:hypothetical protein